MSIFTRWRYLPVGPSMQTESQQCETPTRFCYSSPADILADRTHSHAASHQEECWHGWHFQQNSTKTTKSTPDRERQSGRRVELSSRYASFRWGGVWISSWRTLNGMRLWELKNFNSSRAHSIWTAHPKHGTRATKSCKQKLATWVNKRTCAKNLVQPGYSMCTQEPTWGGDAPQGQTPRPAGIPHFQGFEKQTTVAREPAVT